MNRSNQLKWMALLALAVVLPTISLLWFMSRVVANERLVIRQKLSAVYRQKLDEAGDQVRRRINARFEALGKTDWSADPYGLLRQLVFEERFQGVVLWDQSGACLYPAAPAAPASGVQPSEGPLAEAWRQEFVLQDYTAAAEAYGRLDEADDPRALAGRVRCLVRLGQWDAAMDAALAPESALAAPARLLLLSLLLDREDAPGRVERMDRIIRALDRDLYGSDSNALPASQHLLIARRLLEYLPDTGCADRELLAERLGALADAEELSLEAALVYREPAGPVDAVVPARMDPRRCYVVRLTAPSGGMLIVLSNEGLAAALDGYRAVLEGTDAQFRILDAHGILVAGDAGEGIPAIVSGPLPRGLPEGRVEFYFADGSAFDRAAGRQIAVYIWTGVLVIMLILMVGAFAGQSVGRQIRLNRMKNDFIATVSHELKTPLASMRLLVDTLLEGRVRDEAHAEEYLGMIARENERLTRMIENFLSFSRMERNRNAFSLAPDSAAAIAEDAIESVCTKFRANGCRLETHIDANLPQIRADHDAMVTVLINLLDNACKYTTADKQIGLSVTAGDQEVCFAVSDNGIGLSRRQVRRIFDSFYQVDRTLARVTEGCGLGLSIVRFIVSAHKGRIEVESEPGRGSIFTVRLPIGD